MAIWGAFGDGQYIANEILAGLDATPENTKGAWEEYFSSVPYHVSKIGVTCPRKNTGFNHLVDIGIGSTSQEIVILSNLFFPYSSYDSCAKTTYEFPVNIPAGTRIVARQQNNSSYNRFIHISLFLSSGTINNFPASGLITEYGADETGSVGTVIDPGAVSDTYGTWVPFSAATTTKINGIHVATGAVDKNSDYEYWDTKIGIGASGIETTVATLRSRAWGGSLSDAGVGTEALLPLSIPVGTRLSICCRSNETDISKRKLYVVLYGVS